MRNSIISLIIFTVLVSTTSAQNIPRPNIQAPQGLAVNSYTGNLFYQRNEMSLRGTGLRIYLSFYYNAATDTLDYGYGHGWSFYYNSFYRENGDTVIVQHSDAKKDTFYLHNGVYKSPVGVYDSLGKSGQQFVLRSKNGRKEFFADPSHKKLTGVTDANGNSIVIRYSDNLPVSIRNSSGRVLLLSWENNHLKEAKDSLQPAKKYLYQYDSKNDFTTVTNPMNGKMSYDYFQHKLVRVADENSNPVVIEYGSGGKVKGITSCNSEQRFTYNSALRKTFVTSKGGSGSIVNGYFFDTGGRLSGLSDASNNSASFIYDNKNNLLEWKDFTGRSTKYQYDAKGNLLKENDVKGNSITYTYEPLFNHPATIKDKRGKTTTLNYDAIGNLIQVTNPDNTTQTFTYDAAGRRKTATDAANHTTTYQYNGDGDLVKIQYPVGEITYDYNGNCCNVGKITDPNGNTLEMTYDLLNRTTSVKDAMGNTATYEYDAAGNVTKETDPNGIAKRYMYDAMNRLAGVTIKAGTWRYEYDGQNNLTKMTDANGHSTLYQYDNKNQLITETDAIDHSTAHDYDAAGNLVKRTDPNGNSVVYKYDELNRLTEKTYDGNSDKYSYDAAGNLIGAYNNNIAYSFEYDNLDRLLKKNILTWGKSLSYTYDAGGNRSTMTDHNGGLTQYVYDANNRLTSLTNPSNLQTTFVYDAGGRILRQNNANGTFSTYHYDVAGRIDSLINWKNSSDKISFFYYTFDQFGNRTSMRNKNGTNTYSYDSSYRLKHVTYADGTIEEFTLDATGNITQQIKNGVSTTNTYNAADEAQTSGISNFLFDANGNTIQKNDSLQRFYKFDGQSRLIEVVVNSKRKISYRYDPFGNKVEKQDTSLSVSKCIYDGNNVLAELNSTNLTESYFTNALGTDRWIILSSGGMDYQYHRDGLNSISQISSISGTVINDYNYNVNGDFISKTDSVKNPVLFTGKFFDYSTNLYDFRNRHFEASIGRFLSKDKSYGILSKPLTTNRYNYVSGNPINYVDLSGNFLVPVFYALGVAAVGTASYVAGVGVGGSTTDAHINRNSGMAQPSVSADLNPDNFIDNNGSKWVRQPQDKNVFHNFGNDEDPSSTLDYISKVGESITGNNADYTNSKYLQANGDGSQTGAEAIWNGKNWISPGDKNGPSWNYGTDGGMDHFWSDILPDFYNPNYNQSPPPEPPLGPNEPPYGPPAPPFPVNIPIIPIITGGDPNEIIGPIGYDTTKKWVSVKANLPYKILFENDPAIATAPAQTVKVYMSIDPKINPSSLRIGDFGFGPFNFTVPENTAIYTNRLDVKDSLGVFVDVTAGLDMANRQAFWIFESIDPATGLAATLPANGGFLPVNDKEKHNGEGFVTLTLKAVANAQSGDTITAKASIVFDTEDTIKTNTWVNTIDAVAPTSKVNLLAASVNPDFPIQWSGKDDTLGSGLKYYTIYYSKNSGPFTLLKENTDSTTVNFPGGDVGATYLFYSIATDNTGNRETQKTTGEAATTVQGLETICPGANAVFSIASLGSDYNYKWQLDQGNGFVDIPNNSPYSGVNTISLNVAAPPTSWSGFVYRCIANNGINTVNSTLLVLRFSNTWKGTVSTAWNNPQNWSCNAIPDEYTDVVMNSEILRQPTLNSHGICRSITLSTGVVMTVAAGFNLEIKGK